MNGAQKWYTRSVEKVSDFLYKAHNTMILQILFNLLQNILLEGHNTFPSASATSGKSSGIAPPECSLAPPTIFVWCPPVIETAFFYESLLILEIAKNHMMPNPESTEPVEQAAGHFSQENLGWHGKDGQEHYHGGAENILLSTYAQLHEVDVKPPGSTLH